MKYDKNKSYFGGAESGEYLPFSLDIKSWEFKFCNPTKCLTSLSIQLLLHRSKIQIHPVNTFACHCSVLATWFMFVSVQHTFTGHQITSSSPWPLRVLMLPRCWIPSQLLHGIGLSLCSVPPHHYHIMWHYIITTQHLIPDILTTW